MAMENTLFIDDFPIETQVSRKWHIYSDWFVVWNLTFIFHSAGNNHHPNEEPNQLWCLPWFTSGYVNIAVTHGNFCWENSRIFYGHFNSYVRLPDGTLSFFVLHHVFSKD